jgi:Rap1a immunity proteins
MRKAIMVVLGLVMLGGSVMAQTPDSFVIDTAGELAVLCSVKPGSPNYTAAIHFCHGYGHGAFHYYKIESLAKGGSKFICFSNPAPTRVEAWNGFLKWLKKNPKYNDGEAVDVLFRYLGETYPCKN